MSWVFVVEGFGFVWGVLGLFVFKCGVVFFICVGAMSSITGA